MSTINSRLGLGVLSSNAKATLASSASINETIKCHFLFPKIPLPWHANWVHFNNDFNLIKYEQDFNS